MATSVADYCYTNPSCYSFRALKYWDIAQHISIILLTKMVTKSSLSSYLE